MPRIDPYGDAPRLPETGPVDLRSLVHGSSIELEIGPGRGGFLFERAAAAPEAGLVGLEVRRKWAKIVDERLRKVGLGARARVFAEDARSVLPRLGPNGSVQHAYLHFPDPWWKKRHQKRLVMGDVFIVEITRLLAPGGSLFVQTDVSERAALYEARLSHEHGLLPMGDIEGSARISENPQPARSPRERRAIADGLPIHRLRYVKR